MAPKGLSAFQRLDQRANSTTLHPAPRPAAPLKCASDDEPVRLPELPDVLRVHSASNPDRPVGNRPLDLPSLHQRLAPLGEVHSTQHLLKFWISPYEITVFPDGRAIIKGTTDPGVARSLYSRYLGM